MIAIYVWSVTVLGLGATMGLLFLTERGQASRAAPTSALMAWAEFGETISAAQMADFILSAAGVALVLFAPGASWLGGFALGCCEGSRKLWWAS